MDYTPETIARLKDLGRLEAHIAAVRGVIGDYSRETVTVHVGKPVGSVSGWAGPLFWQVWTEPGEAANAVHAYVEGGAKETWRIDGGLEEGALLEAARNRVVALAHDRRRAELDAARSRLALLQFAV